MKKILCLVFACVMTIMISACGEDMNNKNPVESGISEMEEILPSQAQNSTQPSEQEKAENFIGEQRAKEIALEKAGISHDDVVFERVELDKDNGIWEYDIEFRKEKTEYDAEINAENGNIIKWEVDTQD